MKSEREFSWNWQYILVGILLLLAITFFAVMLLECVENYFYSMLGITFGEKFTLLQTLGFAMGGILVALQALASHRRAVALEETSNAQVQANQNVVQGQLQERFKNAIEHLGDKSSSVCLGGAYELFQLARDTKDLRQTVFNILCAHIRQTTSEDEYIKKYVSKPSQEIQSLLTMLFVEKHEIFKGYSASLQGSCLNKTNLQEARLENANLEGALLQQANLHQAKLQGSRLMNTNLRGAVIARADLSGAIILTSHMQQTILIKSILRGTTIIGTRMQLANLCETQWQGAVIQDAQMQEAQLTNAKLQGIKSKGVTGNSGDSISIKFVDVIKASIGKESELSAVIFQGGVSKDELEALVAGLSEKDAAQIRTRLAPHINKAKSHKLPEDSGAVTGSYSNEEAEQWIAEYPLAEKVNVY